MEILRKIENKIGLRTSGERYLIDNPNSEIGEKIWVFKDPGKDITKYAVAKTEMTPWDLHLTAVEIRNMNPFLGMSDSEIEGEIYQAFPQHKKDKAKIIYPRGEFSDDEWQS